MTELKPRPFCVGNARKDAEALREILVDDCVDFPHVVHTMLHKAACLIESLSEELEQVKRERDAAIRQMLEADKNNPFACDFCKHDEVCDGRLLVCGDCDMNCPCNTCRDHSNWQWRGVKEEKDER